MKKLKIAFVYGMFCANGKNFNIPNLMNDEQGLSGSETSFFFYARELSLRGHNITIYIDNGTGKFYVYGNHRANIDETFDVVYIWNEPYYASVAKKNTLVMCNIQINHLVDKEKYNDITKLVHIYTSPSKHHKIYLQNKYPEYNWQIINNAVDPSWFNLSLERDPFSLMYASSPDRGLHLLLQAYPKIKREVPKAKLKLFYDFDKWYDQLAVNKSSTAAILELKNRAEYIKYALKEMKNGFDIYHYKNVSKQQICDEMCKTMVLAYPCSIADEYTEGFSCVAMEACAASMVPVLSKQDALDSIYGEAALMVEAPIEQHLDEFTEKVILALTDKEVQEETKEKCSFLSQQYHFSGEVIKLEKLMYNGLSVLNN